MDSVMQVIKFIEEWIEREEIYEQNAIARGDPVIAHDCHRRIFTLQLLLGNIKGRIHE